MIGTENPGWTHAETATHFESLEGIKVKLPAALKDLDFFTQFTIDKLPAKLFPEELLTTQIDLREKLRLKRLAVRHVGEEDEDYQAEQANRKALNDYVKKVFGFDDSMPSADNSGGELTVSFWVSNFKGFDSTPVLSEDLIDKLLQYDHIGLWPYFRYGKGGSGGTTLRIEATRSTEDDSIFSLHAVTFEEISKLMKKYPSNEEYTPDENAEWVQYLKNTTDISIEAPRLVTVLLANRV